MTDQTETPENDRSELAELRDEIRALNERLSAPPRDPQREAADRFLAELKKLQEGQWHHGASVFEDRR